MNELSETVLAAIAAHFRRLKWQCDTWERAEWNLTLDQYIDLWRSRWRDRGRDKLVLMRVEEDKPYQMGNVFIDTRRYQVQRQWALYRRQVERPKPGDESIINANCDKAHIDTK